MGNIVPAAEKPADVQAILGLEMQYVVFNIIILNIYF